MEKEIRALEMKFEKGKNQEMKNILSDFTKLTERDSLRNFMLEQFSMEQGFYRKFKDLLHIIYSLRKYEKDPKK
eukprot:CAMPEP_0114594680 /NCGR_PEP_ID=MMETSP0125-20121206/16353_1 /TAXON_ID=485358 ORGANISM="Aristerostoma sp., Strain ATCC 50986" /NCGR_SAMPLE_ID=MMETSP0125 /ASSEMBLY_ACC=CAM_ASM_000245 /LENGTH=73 /DNA_ID=CAMNT_0001795259 /DNA_START=219 /DNA_END=437 /DNA_ORIENTATION=+